MAKTGFFFYHGDWFKDTRILSLEAKGGWIDLLGPLYESGGTLDWPIVAYARFWGVTDETVMNVLTELQHFKIADIEFYGQNGDFSENGKTWQTHGKGMTKFSNVMAKIICRKIFKSTKNAKHIHDIRSDAGRNGAEKRWQNDGKNGNLLNLNLNPSLNNKERILDKKIQEGVAALRLDPKKWDQFVSFRQEIRKPLTEYAADLAIKKLKKLKDAGNDPSAVIDQSILSGWAGLFAVKQDRRGLPNGTDRKFVG